VPETAVGSFAGVANPWQLGRLAPGERVLDLGSGAGTAMVYPTLIAAVSDASQPRDRARVVGVYRFWRDFGFVLGALVAGFGADATSPRTAIVIVAVLTGASGVFVAGTSWQPRRALRPASVP
jgi:MFS family permease